MPANLVTLSFFRYPRRQAWGAFLRMGFPGVIDAPTRRSGELRLLGCGSGSGFSILPDFTRYCLMGVPERPEDLPRLRQTRLYRSVAGPSVEQLHITVRPASGHGSWDGEQLFDYSGREVGEHPFAVLTLATVAPKRVRAFWRQVPAVDRSLSQAEGCLWHVGFGSHPLLQLATFSVWENLDAMRAFAYREGQHPTAIKKARGEDWLPESLFARFELEAIEGDVDRYPRLAALVASDRIPHLQALSIAS
ncbi:DUF3291 domain-containing protein [Afifella marina]|uniref:Spheroidene monooxygenase n=1 Tax=Afifella marina DSM 2698 TaxID=1120955 RepID=A0A1G5P7U9_AFIMA|nr:DUF3291 domain-containing protein [Afifella marina]MBK1624843.1 DUF3291 domain-containing protein [Afifella marina DSM 2698]MBK1628437.1 DUF3291 domain-containing protein [Afifella marina]MBK5917924.1 hypothetical protein [Afifella marina]RAI18736.1 hypothetical protein CH311_14800 [Afifella marina DSM 2698]SCZ45199.1 protein of unknown function [Afifella marina DSM 2698]